MKIAGLMIGILLMLLPLLVVFVICLMLPSMTNNRINAGGIARRADSFGIDRIFGVYRDDNFGIYDAESQKEHTNRAEQSIVSAVFKNSK
jgi:hypothetical protein